MRQQENWNAGMGVRREGVPRRDVLRWSLAGAFGLSMPAILAACGDDGGAGGATGTTTAQGTVAVPDNIATTIRVSGVGGGGASVNPLSRIGGTGNHAFGDPLVWVAPGAAEPEPHLVEGWEQKDDLTTVFTLREGVPFQNGAELTAQDVKFSIDTILGEGIGPASSMRSIDEVRVLDNRTFEVVTAFKDPVLVRRMYLVFPVPEAVYDGQTFNVTPIGTGPWKIEEHDTTAQIIRCTRNEDWWRGEVVTPEAEFHGYQDRAAAQSALEAGQLDIAILNPLANQTLAGRDDFQVASPPMGSSNLLTFNTQEPPFDDVRVRQAVNHAIDGNAIVEQVLFGAGFEMPGQLPGEDCYGHDSSFQNPYPYDPERARALLAEAGYADGFTTNLAAGAQFSDVAEAVTGFLRDVGIDATVEPLESSQWLTQFVRGSSEPMFMKPINYSPLYDADVPFNWMTFPPPGAVEGGFQAWTDETWDAMLAESRQLAGDERLSKLHEMTAYLAEECPVAYLYFQTYTYGWASQIKNFDPSTGFFVEYHQTFREA